MTNPTHAMADIVGAQRVIGGSSPSTVSLRPYGACARRVDRARHAMTNRKNHGPTHDQSDPRHGRYCRGAASQSRIIAVDRFAALRGMRVPMGTPL
jgi:hypothetical protein